MTNRPHGLHEPGAETPHAGPPKGAHETAPRPHPRLRVPVSPRWPRLPPRRGRATSRRYPAVVTPPGNRSRARSSPWPDQIVDDEVNKPWFGWRPNTIVFGKMGLTDNVNNLQLARMVLARRTVVVLNEHMTRFATTEATPGQPGHELIMASPDNIGSCRPPQYCEVEENLEQISSKEKRAVRAG